MHKKIKQNKCKVKSTKLTNHSSRGVLVVNRKPTQKDNFLKQCFYHMRKHAELATADYFISESSVRLIHDKSVYFSKKPHPYCAVIFTSAAVRDICDTLAYSIVFPEDLVARITVSKSFTRTKNLFDRARSVFPERY